MEHFLQGNIPLRHLLNAKPPFNYERRSAFNEVNAWAPSVLPISNYVPISAITDKTVFKGYAWVILMSLLK